MRSPRPDCTSSPNAVKHLPEGVPLTLHGVMRGNMMISGGTFHSAMAQMSRLTRMRQVAQIVQRSAAACADYGPDFTYIHYASLQKATTLAAALAGLAAFVAPVQVPPLRRLLGTRIPQGDGPSESRRARSWFTVDFIGEGGGRQVHTQVRGGDPGYSETAKMLAEAAMCLAFDDNPQTFGQVTTVTAMGENLLQRLIDAGISFDVVDSATPATSGETLA